MPKKTFAHASARLARRLEQLARVSDEHMATTRTFLSPAMRQANELVGGWMESAGLSVRVDQVGNLIGRREGTSARARTLLLGSHLDTVRDAGRFDGTLGVLLPIAALECIRQSGTALPFAVEVLGFSEEEGVRFSSAYLGSKGYTGRLMRSDLQLRDSQGVKVEQALEEFNGARLLPLRPAHTQKELMGYVEVHIEQGPVLESQGLAAGCVTGIAGQTRARVTFRGVAGHAGTTPMSLRKDALAGAAEFILAVESLARRQPRLVATVGRILAHPGADNVIPGIAELSLDVRHPDDGRRHAAFSAFRTSAQAIARKRHLTYSVEVTQDNNAVSCSADLTDVLAQSVQAKQGRSFALASGAGHDAVILSSLTPIAMLFVRCRKGLSHHPDEYVHSRDLHVGLEIIVDFLLRLASRPDI